MIKVRMKTFIKMPCIFNGAYIFHCYWKHEWADCQVHKTELLFPQCLQCLLSFNHLFPLLHTEWFLQNTLWLFFIMPEVEYIEEKQITHGYVNGVSYVLLQDIYFCLTFLYSLSLFFYLPFLITRFPSLFLSNSLSTPVACVCLSLLLPSSCSLYPPPVDLSGALFSLQHMDRGFAVGLLIQNRCHSHPAK